MQELHATNKQVKQSNDKNISVTFNAYIRETIYKFFRFFLLTGFQFHVRIIGDSTPRPLFLAQNHFSAYIFYNNKIVPSVLFHFPIDSLFPFCLILTKSPLLQ